MLTAHLPSGYIVGKIMKSNIVEGAVLPAALIGGIVPDLDMIYFYFVDGGKTHHHMFFPHWPLAWVTLCLPLIGLLHINHRPALRNASIAFFVAVMLHMVLDSIAAPIFWLMPFAESRVELFTVPALYDHWILSFLFHWTFLGEIIIWLGAVFLYFQPSAPVAAI